jgi:hypothetical protein
MTIDPALSLAFALATAALFAAAATHKLLDLSAAATSIRAYRIAPSGLAPAVAPVIAAVEGAIAIGLLFPASRAGSGLAAAFMLALYAGAMLFNLRRGRRDLDCGCSFGAGGNRISEALVARNAALAIIALVAAMAPGARALTALDIGSAIGFALAAAALYLAFEAIVRNFDRQDGDAHRAWGLRA